MGRLSGRLRIEMGSSKRGIQRLRSPDWLASSPLLAPFDGMAHGQVPHLVTKTAGGVGSRLSASVST
jgi:hypothetical protein